MIPPVKETPWIKEIRAAQRQDATLKTVSQWKKRPEWGEIAHESREVKSWWSKWNHLTEAHGLVWYAWMEDDGQITWKVILPVALQETVIQELHGRKKGGHLGVRKTGNQVQKSPYYWHGLWGTVEKYCTKCDICTKTKKPDRVARDHLDHVITSESPPQGALEVNVPLPKEEADNRTSGCSSHSERSKKLPTQRHAHNNDEDRRVKAYSSGLLEPQEPRHIQWLRDAKMTGAARRGSEGPYRKQTEHPDRKVWSQKIPEGSLVWLHDPPRKERVNQRLTTLWEEEPYLLVQYVSDVTVELKKINSSHRRVAHVHCVCPVEGPLPRPEEEEGASRGGSQEERPPLEEAGTLPERSSRLMQLPPM